MTKPPDDHSKALASLKSTSMHFTQEGVLWHKKGGAGHVKDHVAVDDELLGDQGMATRML